MYHGLALGPPVVEMSKPQSFAGNFEPGNLPSGILSHSGNDRIAGRSETCWSPIQISTERRRQIAMLMNMPRRPGATSLYGPGQPCGRVHPDSPLSHWIPTVTKTPTIVPITHAN